MKLPKDVLLFTFLTRNKLLVGAIGAALLIMVAYTLVRTLVDHSLRSDPAAARNAGAPMPVLSVRVERGLLDSVVGGECVTQAAQTASLKTALIYPVTNVAVNVGDIVAKGQVLVTLDPTTLNDELAYYERIVALTEKLAADFEPFFANLESYIANNPKSGLIATFDLTRIYDSLEEHALDRERAIHDRTRTQRELEKLNLTAPFDGVVTARNVAVGAIPDGADELLVVSQLNPLQLDCAFAEDQLSKITTADSAEITFTAYPERRITHKKFFTILPIVDSKTRTSTARILLDNESSEYLPGMNAVVRLSKSTTALRIPAISTINPRGEKASVFVVDSEERVRLREIVTGWYAEGFVEVVEGLNEGDRVVVSGQTYLLDGDKVLEGEHELSPLYYPSAPVP